MPQIVFRFRPEKRDNYMLANAYMPAITAIFTGIFTLLLAMSVELPVLKLIWRRHLLVTVGWVLLANLASAAIGFVRTFYDAGPGWTADPWEVYQQNISWTRGIGVAILLILTLASEGAVYCFFGRLTKPRLSWLKLLVGLLASNLASYGIILTLIIWGGSPQQNTDFRSDTSWLHPCNERVWFVEPGSHHLCSICLDGTDLRKEVKEPLGRFMTYQYNASLYAIIPETKAVLYVSREREWCIAKGGTITSLGMSVQQGDHGYLRDSNVFEVFPAALRIVDERENIDLDAVWSNINPRLYSFVTVSDEAGGFHAQSSIHGGGGSGTGLELKGPTGDIDFKISAGPGSLPCNEPAILPDRKLVVFRCSAWIMVMDLESRLVGRLVPGDSLVAVAPAFKYAPAESSNQPSASGVNLDVHEFAGSPSRTLLTEMPSSEFVERILGSEAYHILAHVCRSQLITVGSHSGLHGIR